MPMKRARLSAAGTVVSVGPEARLFKPGDAVFYAGALDRPGSNAALQCVDERLVGAKPATLDFAAAAALPLTALTAWEMLFDRLDVARPVPGATPAILIVGGAGGVGGFLLAAGLGVVKQHAGSYAPGLWAFAAIALAASLCLVGVKQRWRLHWAAAGAARV